MLNVTEFLSTRQENQTCSIYKKSTTNNHEHCFLRSKASRRITSYICLSFDLKFYRPQQISSILTVPPIVGQVYFDRTYAAGQLSRVNMSKCTMLEEAGTQMRTCKPSIPLPRYDCANWTG